ncbi:MAG: extracellular solute-binding protein [Paenibacillaceae bacterium]|nr:extracellular solute-binding protein [Paenibacillaceae bacterium]
MERMEMIRKQAWKRTMSLVTAGSLVASLAAGCSGGNGGEGAAASASVSPKASASASATPAPTKAPPTPLKVFMVDSGGNYSGEAIKYIEEKTNTKLTITAVVGGANGVDLENRLNVTMASGDIPDVIQFFKDETELKYVSSGLLVPLSDYFDKAPNLKNSRTAADWNAMKHPDGKIYAVGTKSPDVHFVSMYRKDWLDKLSLKVPTTIEEYYQVADAIANRDPDGNGKKDTFAFGSVGAIGRYFDHIFGAYGVLPNYWMLKDGKVVSGSIQPEAKEALKFLNKMYTNKLIDPEFVTDTIDRNRTKFKNGVYGAQANFIWMFDANNVFDYYKPFKDKNPNGEWVEGPVLQAPGFQSVGMRKLTARGVNKTAITKNSKNIDAALRLLDWLASPEGNTFTNYGIKGVHYEIGSDNVVKTTADAKTLNDYGVNQVTLAKDALFDHTTASFKQVKAFTEKNALTNPVDGMLIPETAKYEKDLISFTDAEYFKMILGATPIDGGFEKFVDEYNKRGGKEYQAALDKEYQSRKK